MSQPRPGPVQFHTTQFDNEEGPSTSKASTSVFAEVKVEINEDYIYDETAVLENKVESKLELDEGHPTSSIEVPTRPKRRKLNIPSKPQHTCPEPNCLRRFKREVDLKQHLRKQPGPHGDVSKFRSIRDMSCAVCHLNFTRVDYVASHFRSHFCILCGCTFQRPRDRVQHIRKHHPGKNNLLDKHDENTSNFTDVKQSEIGTDDIDNLNNDIIDNDRSKRAQCLKCPICQLSLPGSLNNHFFKHYCEICGARFEDINLKTEHDCLHSTDPTATQNFTTTDHASFYLSPEHEEIQDQTRSVTRRQRKPTREWSPGPQTRSKMRKMKEKSTKIETISTSIGGLEAKETVEDNDEDFDDEVTPGDMNTDDDEEYYDGDDVDGDDEVITPTAHTNGYTDLPDDEFEQYAVKSKQGRYFNCPRDDCQQKFWRVSVLKRHLRVHDGRLPYHCTICGDEFEILSNLWKHKKKRHDSSKPFECRVTKACYLKFASAEELEAHVKIHARNEPEREKRLKAEEPFLRCDACNKSFETRCQWNTHRKYEHNLVKLQCEHCRTVLNNWPEYSTHMKVCLKLFACSRCGTAFSEDLHLIYHKRTSDCGKEEASCETLKNEINDSELQMEVNDAINASGAPTTSEPSKRDSDDPYPFMDDAEFEAVGIPVDGRMLYKCPIDDCTEYGFWHVSKFKRHLRAHRGMPAFECPVCGKEMQRSNQHASHMKHKHGELLTFECHIEGCVRKYVSRKLLEEHMDARHRFFIDLITEEERKKRQEAEEESKPPEERERLRMERRRKEIEGTVISKYYKCDKCYLSFSKPRQLEIHLTGGYCTGQSHNPFPPMPRLSKYRFMALEACNGQFEPSTPSPEKVIFPNNVMPITRTVKSGVSFKELTQMQYDSSTRVQDRPECSRSQLPESRFQQIVKLNSDVCVGDYLDGMTNTRGPRKRNIGAPIWVQGMTNSRAIPTDAARTASNTAIPEDPVNETPVNLLEVLEKVRSSKATSTLPNHLTPTPVIAQNKYRVVKVIRRYPLNQERHEDSIVPAERRIVRIIKSVRGDSSTQPVIQNNCVALNVARELSVLGATKHFHGADADSMNLSFGTNNEVIKSEYSDGRIKEENEEVPPRIHSSKIQIADAFDNCVMKEEEMHDGMHQTSTNASRITNKEGSSQILNGVYFLKRLGGQEDSRK